MTKRAFLFGGQGAQKLGMASDLYAAYPIVKETFDTASRILGYDLRELIDSNEEKLNQTRYTQPAILTTSVAIYRLLAENGIAPDIVAGLSLGEYSALVAAGALSFEDAVALVAKRGEFMETAAPAGSGKVSFNDFVLPLVGNTEAQIMKSEDVKALLARQVMEPVRFYDSIATIQDFGVDEVIEIGPGKILSGFLKKIDKTLPTQNVEDQASLDALLNA